MKKNDWILICILLVVAVGFYIGIHVFQEKGSTVIVTVDGEEVASFPLDEDTTYEITGVDSGYNTLVIADGEAYLSDADCPDLVCVHTGKISQEGETIVCLPHKVVVSIEGDGLESGDEDIDAVVK